MSYHNSADYGRPSCCNHIVDFDSGHIDCTVVENYHSYCIVSFDFDSNCMSNPTNMFTITIIMASKYSCSLSCKHSCRILHCLTAQVVQPIFGNLLLSRTACQTHHLLNNSAIKISSSNLTIHLLDNLAC